MKKCLITVNGFPRAGKDTFMDAVVEEAIKDNRTARKHSAVETSKSIFYLLGWDGVKTPEMRNGLSDLNDLYIKYFDGPYKEVINLIETHDIVCATAREPKLLERYKKYCEEKGYNFSSVLIRSNREERDHSNHADTKILQFEYQYLFENHKSKEELIANAKSFYYYIGA